MYSGKGFSKGTIRMDGELPETKKCSACGVTTSLCWRVGGRRCGTHAYCNECGLKINARKQQARLQKAQMRRLALSGVRYF